MKVRVRYAPSPTGLQHIGGIRTALFNYLLAKHYKGSFLLRIEDTDRERFRNDALDDLYKSLGWLDLKPDEGPREGGDFGPYEQSKRMTLYKSYEKELLEKGGAYRCFCTKERLDRLRAIQSFNKQPTGYDRHCRSLTEEEIQKKLNEKVPYVVRLKMPKNEIISFQDGILGAIEFNSSDLNPDPILIKSDGYPTYHFANVIDDHHMEITHVMRAQEWLPSTPMHIVMYRTFGWEPPQFFHLPMVLGQDGQKLSKRHGSTALVEFRNQGYLKEAILNYLALVGWSYDGKREWFSLEELKTFFDEKGLHKSSGVFDYKKLQHFNAHYIGLKTDTEFLDLVLPFFEKESFFEKEKHLDLLKKTIPLLKQRVKILSEAPLVVNFLFTEDLKIDKENLFDQTKDSSFVQLVLKKGLEINEKFHLLNHDEKEKLFKDMIEHLKCKPSAFYIPLRVALTAKTHSFGVVDIFWLLGEKIVEKRLQKALQSIE